MSIQSIIQKKPTLAWYIANPENMSDESVVEHVLQYGNWHDVQELINMAGIAKVSKIFHKTIQKKRCNYSPQIQNYFQLYFKNYA